MPTEDSRKASKEAPSKADIVERQARLEHWPPSLFVYMDRVRRQRQAERERRLAARAERLQKKMSRRNSDDFSDDDDDVDDDEDEQIDSTEYGKVAIGADPSRGSSLNRIAEQSFVSFGQRNNKSAQSWSHSQTLKKMYVCNRFGFGKLIYKI